MSFKPMVLLVFFSLFVVLFSVGSAGQSGGSSPSPPPFHQPAPDDEDRARAEELAKKANQERQAQLKRDTDDLLKLATELKQYVDKSNENILSMDVIRKADEIEKLAHNVKEKMKGN